MKNAIQYYYNLIPSDIRQSKKSYFFQIGEQFYYLTPYERNPADINILYEISVQLFQRNVYCHQFVVNRMNELITVINEVSYVLLQYFVDVHAKVTLDDVLFFSNLSVMVQEDSPLKRNHWRALWMTKNDYFEYQVSEFGKSYPLIRESFSYFLGMSEIGIMLLNQVPQEVFSQVVLSHRRVLADDTLLEFYNPLTFVLDVRVRDVAEYFKEKIVMDSISFSQLEQCCYTLRLQGYELLLLFIRMLYPSFYFDRYEKVIDKVENEEILEDIISSIPRYELFLRDLYLFVKQYIHIDTIYWLEKK